MTNNHVIRGATSIKVVIPGTKRVYTARVVGYDVADDVAVLRAVGASHLKTVSTAASVRLRIGQAVRAVGNANGTGRLLSARGSITGLRRSIAVSDDAGGTESLAGLIETNAALQPDDSGGPLLNSAGKVIGMDTAASARLISTAADSYAIPIGKALSVAKQIVAGPGSSRVHVGPTAFVGIQVQGAGAGGLVVAGVVPGGPAEAAGLEAGDDHVDRRRCNHDAALAHVVLADEEARRHGHDRLHGSAWRRSHGDRHACRRATPLAARK